MSGGGEHLQGKRSTEGLRLLLKNRFRLAKVEPNLALP